MAHRGPARTAFVTGGTGFLGQHLVRQLAELGWQVVALHRSGSDVGSLIAAGARPVEGVLHDRESVADAMPANCDAVFHLAGNTTQWRREYRNQLRDNVIGTRALVAAALDRGVKRFIFTSSISAWGYPEVDLITEETRPCIDRRITHYGRTKFLAEQEVRAGIRQGLDAVILNPCAIMGAGDRHNWSQMIGLIDQGKLPGVPPGGSSFCHVQEVAAAHIGAFERGRCGENYILAGVDASFLELVRIIAHQLGQRAPSRTIPASALRIAGALYPLGSLFTGREPSLTPDKVTMVTRRIRASGEKAIRELDFNASMSLEVMVEDCIAWMRDTGLLPPRRQPA